MNSGMRNTSKEMQRLKPRRKAVKNAVFSDRKQLIGIGRLLGKDMPKHFADFQEMKYNES